MQPKYDEFYFTFGTDESTGDKLFAINQLKNTMDNALNFKDYSHTIHNIHCMFLAFPENDPIPKKPWKRHSKKRKMIELGLKLDYEKVLQANENEMLQMMAQLYLDAIKMYPNVRGKVKLSEFDYIRFYEDVAALFVEQGWVKKQPMLKATANT